MHIIRGVKCSKYFTIQLSYPFSSLFAFCFCFRLVVCHISFVFKCITLFPAKKNPSIGPTSCGLGALSCHCCCRWPKQATLLRCTLQNRSTGHCPIVVVIGNHQARRPKPNAQVAQWPLLPFDWLSSAAVARLELLPSLSEYPSIMSIAVLIFNLINNLLTTCECLVCG